MITLETNGASNIAVLQCGEPFEQIGAGFEDYIKIALIGSTDLIDGGELDWYSKFIQGLAIIAGRENAQSINVFKNLNYLVFNCKTPKVADGSLSVNNPEFMSTLQWVNYASTMADAVFVNFLRRSTSPMPLYWFSMLSGSGKLVVRVPNEESYIYSGLVNATCNMLNIPVFVGRIGNVLTVLQSMFSFIPKMQTLNNPAITLPE